MSPLIVYKSGCSPTLGMGVGKCVGIQGLKWGVDLYEIIAKNRQISGGIVRIHLGKQKCKRFFV